MTGQNFPLALFIERINAIVDTDYGDFMRSANVYICNLRDALLASGDTVKGKIAEMQTYTQFASDWVVESTKSRLLKDSEEIRTWLMGERQVEHFKPLRVTLPEYHKFRHWLHQAP